MAVFAAHVVLMRDFQAVTFAPGDDLPEWAEGLVGDHVLTADEVESPVEPDPEAAPVVEAGPEDAVPEDNEPVDFTGPKPRGTRQRRG